MEPLDLKKKKANGKFLKPAFLLTASRGQFHWFQKEIGLHVILRANSSTSHAVHYLSKQVLCQCLASVLTFKQMSNEAC